MEFLKELRKQNEIAKCESQEARETIIVTAYARALPAFAIIGFVITSIVRVNKGWPAFAHPMIGIALVLITVLFAWHSKIEGEKAKQKVKVELIDDDILDEIDYLIYIIERGAKYEVIGDIDESALIEVDREYEVELSKKDDFSQSILTFYTPEGMKKTIAVNKENSEATKGIVREVVSVSLKNKCPVDIVNVAYLKTPL